MLKTIARLGSDSQQCPLSQQIDARLRAKDNGREGQRLQMRRLEPQGVVANGKHVDSLDRSDRRHNNLFSA
jgi:hypothetical protein